MNICVLSGSTNHQLRSDINHRIYARHQSYDYLFDRGPYSSLRNAYLFKLHSVARVLTFFEWVFWIDDDAWFTDFDKTLELFVAQLDPRVFFVACKSPVTPQGHFTFLNSGVFFLRNCPRSVSFLNEARRASLDAVQAWWDPQTLGLFTNGDQDLITFVIHQEHLLEQIVLLPCDAFNNRPYQYRYAPNEHFIVHFPGVRDKAAATRAFGTKFGLHEATLVPHALLERYGVDMIST